MAKPINFEHVEALRKHMLLRGQDMAYLFQVSRMTYYGWVTGKVRIRENNASRVRRVLRKLLVLMHENQWPDARVVAASADERLDLLKQALGRE